MAFNKNQSKTFKRSALALCVMALSAPSFVSAQGDAEEVEEVVVTGMRQALSSAQDIKRNAATVVESITAKDLGSFPDKSVAEALQRVAGITVNRFAASDDTAHFSAEPSGVVVRGLNQVRTEFNGRDSFSANSSRGLSWGDVSPELMSGVDTYKNQMAELIEGGIAGTVNMRTRVPFDSEGEMIALTVSANYGDLSKEMTPEVSGLYSNRWETSSGEWGFMANFAHSEVVTQSQNNQLYRMNRFEDVYDTTNVGADGNVNNSPINADSYVYIPAAIRMLDNVYERERNGISLAGQWKDNEEKFIATLQFNRTEYKNAWEEYIVGVYPADLSFGQSVFWSVRPDQDDNANWRVPPSAPQPNPGADPFVFGQNGLFQSGHMTADIGWWGNRIDESGSWDDPANLEAMGFASNAAGQPMVTPCYGWNGCEPNRRGLDMTTTTRSQNNKNATQDIGFNLKWSPTDSFRANFDFQYVDSEVSNYDIETNFNTWADVYLDVTGKPKVELSAPTNVNMSPGMWSNPNNYYIRSIMDHLEDSEGEELAAKADFEFDIDSGWLTSVKTGIRFADRDQVVRWSGYNWQNVSNTWTGNNAPYFNLDRHEANPSTGFTGYPQGYYETRSFKGNFFNLNETQFVFANMDLLQDQHKFASQMSATALGLTGGVGWDPICSNTGDRASEKAGTCFTPAETVDVSEETSAIYLQLNFGGDSLAIAGMPLSGNIGVRYVETEVVSTGGLIAPRLGEEYFFRLDPDPNNPGETIRTPLPMLPENLGCEVDDSPMAVVPGSLGCYLSEADVAYMNGANFDSRAVSKFDNLLPSLNIKLDINDEWVARFAASKAISRPDIGNLRSYLSVSSVLPSTQNASDPLWVKNANGEIVGANVKYRGDAQNPYLKPVEATQYDLSLEYYFADVGSLTATIFYKEFDNYIQFGTYNREVVNQGVTRTVEVRGPLNGDGAEIQGYELSFQRYMDFLPEPFDGLGIQANYTYVDNKGITNSDVKNNLAEATTITGQAPDQIRVNKLEGLSEDSYNLVLMYEKGDWASRLAYSWRSEYLQTAIDCCVAYPVWTDSTGMLDGSIQYKLTDNLTLKFAASNILNEQTKLKQQVTHSGPNETGTPESGDNLRPYGLKLPNAYMQADRRYTLTLSFQY